MPQRSLEPRWFRTSSLLFLLLSGCAGDEAPADSAAAATASDTSSAATSNGSSSAPTSAVSPVPPAASPPLTPSLPSAPNTEVPLPPSTPTAPGTTPLPGNAGAGGTPNDGSAGEGSAEAGNGGDAGSDAAAGAGGSNTAEDGGAGDGVAGNATAGNGGTLGTAGSTNGGSAGEENTGGTPQVPLGPLTVYIAGDSTVSTYNDTASTTDQAGWGQMLGEYFSADVTIENRAIGGRTARRFIDEGYLAEIDADIEAGDYLLVQFGTNDGNQNASYELDGQTIPYYLDPDTDFKMYLMQYLDVANAHQATLVFVTPPPRNSAYCTGGNGTGAHAQAMRELGMEEGVAVSDLNAKTVAHLVAICPSPTPEDFFLLRGDGSVDGTHFQENGARIMAGFVADGIAEANLPLAQFLE